MVKVVAVDGTDPRDLSGVQDDPGRVLAEWEQDHPLSQGEDVTLPCGRRMIVKHVVEDVGGAVWRQWVAVVSEW